MVRDRQLGFWVSEGQARETDKGQAGTLPSEQAAGGGGGREPWRAVHSTEGRCQSEASILQLIAGEWDSVQVRLTGK